MALSDKNIVITPNISQTADPKIVFSGADSSTSAQTITLQVYPTNSGTLSFEGSSGQLFSITNSMSGTIYSVNDVSGVPSIEVLDSGLVKIGQYSGNVLIGTGADSGAAKLQVAGNVASTGWMCAAGGIFTPWTICSACNITSASNIYASNAICANGIICSGTCLYAASQIYSSGCVVANGWLYTSNWLCAASGMCTPGTVVAAAVYPGCICTSSNGIISCTYMCTMTGNITSACCMLSSGMICSAACLYSSTCVYSGGPICAASHLCAGCCVYAGYYSCAGTCMISPTVCGITAVCSPCICATTSFYGYLSGCACCAYCSCCAGCSATLNGLSKIQMWNNSGFGHTCFTSFAGPPDFGEWFVHQEAGCNDGPGAGAVGGGPCVQYYSKTVGLGCDYCLNNYAMQTAIARDVTQPYHWARYKEGCTWKAWTKVAAGYADFAGCTCGNVTGCACCAYCSCCSLYSYCTCGNITGNASTATMACATCVYDRDRTLASAKPCCYPHQVVFDFANAGQTGTGGNYSGVMTIGVYDGTCASTGDASYQLAFGSSAACVAGIPQLRIRNGLNTEWQCWYTILHEGNSTSYCSCCAYQSCWASKAVFACCVCCNPYTSTGTYPIAWFSGNQLYTTTNICVYPNTCGMYVAGCIWTGGWLGSGGWICATSGLCTAGYMCATSCIIAGGYLYTSNWLCAASGVCTAGNVVAYNSSDCRLKENVNQISCALDKVNRLTGVEYDWNEEGVRINGGNPTEDGKTPQFKSHDVGLIAQEVEKVLPEAVQLKEDGYLGVRYERLIPLLVEAIKELQNKVNK